MRISYFLVFVTSSMAACLMLLIERLSGINWDFHRDAVTYITESSQITNLIIQQGFTSLPNNGYYIICNLLDQNISLIITYNIILFSITNILLAKIHWDLSPSKKRSINLLILLLILNPYRMHLATTLLKDTTIIFLLAIFLSRFKFSWLALPVLYIIRIASLIYIPPFFPKIKLIYIIPVFVISIFLAEYYFNIISIIDAASYGNLVFRDFDTIPTFQEYGYLGSLLRCLLWPVIAITGLFAIISPAPLFFAVAIGCLMNVIYSALTRKKLIPLTYNLYFSMAAIAIITPGFTTYIRYVYPLITIAPFLPVLNGLRKNQHG